MEINKILLIDDEDDIRMVAQIALEKVGGMQTLLASGGEEGLRMASSEQPDLILLDMMMPGKDGEETLRDLRADPSTASIPVVFMTARVQPKEIQSYLMQGAAGVINKPFDPMLLSAEIRKLAADL